jgi:hypothetical protein
VSEDTDLLDGALLTFLTLLLGLTVLFELIVSKRFKEEALWFDTEPSSWEAMARAVLVLA